MNGPKFLTFERGKIGILIIEADVQIHRLLEIALQPYGYDVKLATYFRHGLDLFEQHLDDIAVVLIGGSILGSYADQILSAFQTLQPQIPVLVMTGDILAHDPETLLKLGFLHVFKKPFPLADLIDVLQKTLESTKPAEHHKKNTNSAASEEDQAAP